MQFGRCPRSVQASANFQDALELQQLEAVDVCTLLAELGSASMELLNGLQTAEATDASGTLDIPEDPLATSVAALVRLGATCTVSSHASASQDGAATRAAAEWEALQALDALGAQQSELPVRSSLAFATGGSREVGGTGRRLLARASGRGKARTSAGATDAVATADVTKQNWQANDTEIASAELRGVMPPPRRLGHGNSLMAGLLLRQVCSRSAQERSRPSATRASP